MKRSLEQQRAAFALGFVTRHADAGAKLATHIQKTPIRILQNGLGQALAFLLSNNEGATGHARKPSGHLYDCLQEWLCGKPTEPGQSYPCRVYQPAGQGLISQLINGSRTDYQRAQAEALALFVWLKKFSDAWLGKAQGGDD